MTHRFNLFLVAFVTFGLLDSIWLGTMSLARLTARKLAPLWGPVLFVYVLLAFGIVTFVLPRNYREASIAQGALFGLVVYGVYDLTTLTTLRGRAVLVAAIDIAWGATASAISTWIVVIAHRLLK